MLTEINTPQSSQLAYNDFSLPLTG